MRHVLLLLAVFAVSPLLGCGSTSIGDKCTADDCKGDGRVCRLDFPGTYCAQVCTQEGQAEGCRDDSICAEQFTDTLLCSRTCQTQDDCREGYECNGVTGSTVKVCRVKQQEP